MELLPIVIVVYLWGVIVTTIALVDSLTVKEVSAACLVALFWFILIPAGLLKKALHLH